ATLAARERTRSREPAVDVLAEAEHAAGQHGPGTPQAQEVGGIPERVEAARLARRDGRVGTRHPEENGGPTRRRVQHRVAYLQPRVATRQGLPARRPLAQRPPVEGRDAADGSERRADGDADPIVARGIRSPVPDTCILERQLRPAREQQGRPVEVPDALGADEWAWGEFGDLSREPAPAGPHWEQRQRTQAGRAGGEAAPEGLPTGAERGGATATP